MTPPASLEEGTSEEDGLLLQKKLLDDVSETRPLAKLQEEMEEDTDTLDTATTGASAQAQTNDSNGTEGEDEMPPTAGQGAMMRHRKPLLNDNDHELDRLSRVRLLLHDRGVHS